MPSLRLYCPTCIDPCKNAWKGITTSKDVICSQWWILSNLAKGNVITELHTLDNKNTLGYFNDILFWENLEN